MKQQLSLLLKRILSRLPSKLPVGVKEFEKFADDIIELSGNYADRDSMSFAVASMIIHADARHGALPKNYFVVRMRKSAANQIASQVFQEIKSKQAAQQAAAKPSEDTASKETTNQNGEKAAH